MELIKFTFFMPRKTTISSALLMVNRPLPSLQGRGYLKLIKVTFSAIYIYNKDILEYRLT